MVVEDVKKIEEKKSGREVNGVEVMLSMLSVMRIENLKL